MNKLWFVILFFLAYTCDGKGPIEGGYLDADSAWTLKLYHLIADLRRDTDRAQKERLKAEEERLKAEKKSKRYPSHHKKVDRHSSGHF